LLKIIGVLIMKNLLIFFLLIGLGFAQSKVTIQDSEIVINDNEAVVEVLGMVCSMCAFGIGEGFSQTNFIDKSKFTDGVSVDIDAQYVQIGLLDSENVKPEKIVQVIEDAGYDVNLLFILQNEKLTKFNTDNLGILQPIAFNLTSDNN
tara:strand:- start:184 stop:627 length:444 start_codon:yes stop_codon:yes gene_type:complete